MQSKKKPHGNNQAVRVMKGEIVKVQGGHIARSTGSKDRHSKVCTAKGLRDRRVRLSAQTAIQFYDVQDRLGYDRPSKAVDWLIAKAKSAIDDLAKLPPWNPLLHRDSSHEEEERDEEEDTSKSTFPPNPMMEQSQDLRLSLHPHYSYHNLENPFPAAHHHWSAEAATSDGARGGYLYASPTTHYESQMLCQNGGTLQSSYSPSIRAWLDPSMVGAEHRYYYHGLQMHPSMSFDGGNINKPTSSDSLR